MSTEQIKHLEFLQAIITRMNTNSFQLKTMCVTLVSAILGFAFTLDKAELLFVSLMPILLFWVLDAYYLQQERKFRGIYHAVAGLKPTPDIPVFSMPVHKFTGEKYKYTKVLCSETLLLFYVPMLIITAVIGLLLEL